MIGPEEGGAERGRADIRVGDGRRLVLLGRPVEDAPTRTGLEAEDFDEVGDRASDRAPPPPYIHDGGEGEGGEGEGDGDGNDDADASFESEGSASSSLLEEVRTLTDDEVRMEWLDAARYDDLRVLRAIHHVRGCGRNLLEVGESAPTTTADPSCWMGWSARDGQGNTALHRAAANGHADVVRWLLRTHDELCGRRPSGGANPSEPSTTTTTADFIMLPNASGNTALHWAAANGRADVVKLLLLDCGRARKPNGPPLPNNADTEPDGSCGVDVLVRNHFGRSVLTEGFQSDNQDVIQAILEHPSAAEERLLDGGPAQPTNGTKGAPIHKDAVIVEDDSDSTSIIQDLVFGAKFVETSMYGSKDDGPAPMIDTIPTEEMNVRVREVAMATRSDQIVADQDRPEHDRTGLSVWSSSVVAAHWMANIDLAPALDDGGTSGVVALELGAGCAVPSLVVARRLSAQGPRSGAPPPDSRPHHAVYASDWNAEVLDNIRHNFQINDLPGEAGNCDCHAVRMDWNDPASWMPWSAGPPAPSVPDDKSSVKPNDPVRKPSIIVGADLIYQTSMVDALVRAVATLLDRDAPHARFYYVAPTAPRRGGPELIRRLLQEFRLVHSAVAPQAVRRNPLKSQDDDECFLHFQELMTADFRLYEFAWK